MKLNFNLQQSLKSVKLFNITFSQHLLRLAVILNREKIRLQSVSAATLISLTEKNEVLPCIINLIKLEQAQKLLEENQNLKHLQRICDSYSLLEAISIKQV